MQAALQELVDMKASYQKELQAKGEDAIKGVFGELFDKNADLESIEITGYVPYFNDGEACVFGMNEPCVIYKGADYDGTWSVGYSFKNNKITSEDKANLEGIFNSLNSLYQLDDAFEEIFGEHFRITATRDGVEVEEYTEHD